MARRLVAAVARLFPGSEGERAEIVEAFSASYRRRREEVGRLVAVVYLVAEVLPCAHVKTRSVPRAGDGRPNE